MAKFIVLPDDWKERTRLLLDEFANKPPYAFTGRDPLSRAVFLPPDVHRRKEEKAVRVRILKKSYAPLVFLTI